MSAVTAYGPVFRRERDVVKAGLRWINADRASRAGHVGQVIGRCVNFNKLHPDELIWLSNAEPFILNDAYIRDAIYAANWFVSREQGRNHWGIRGGGPNPPKFGRTTLTFLMKSVITVT